MALMAAADVVTQLVPNATTHMYDTYDIFIHPHWKQFPLVPDAWHYAIGVFITIVGLTGVFGNLLVIYIFATTKSLRTPSNMFVVNLALSDLTFSAVNGFPLLTFSAFNRRWIFGKVACELYGLFGGIFGLMSINTMALIATDRYNVIARSMATSHMMTHRKAFLAIVFVWVWSITWAIPPIFGWGAYIPEGFQTSCTFDYLTRSNWTRSYILCLYIFGFCFPVTVIIFAYSQIVKVVFAHEAEMRDMAKRMNAESIRSGDGKKNAEMKTAKISMTIILAYLTSWLPYATVALIAQFGPAAMVTPYVSELPVMFAKASAMHNPIIYALTHPRFREALNQRFPWLLCCCGFQPKEVARFEEKETKTQGDSSKDYTSEMSSCVSHLDDTVEMASPRGPAKGQSQGGVAETSLSGDNNGLVRDILQAFVGVVSAQQQSHPPVQPVYLPPQYLPYALPQPLQAADGRTDVFSISQAALPQASVAADGRVGIPAPLPAGVSSQVAPLPTPAPAAAPAPAPDKAAAPEETTAEVNLGQDNKAFAQ